MKWLKICALIVLTLSAMRAGSWALGWILAKLLPVSARPIAIISNAAAFGLFVLFLWRDLMPGEPLDMAAVLFGLVAFGAYCAGDLFWRPWKARAR